MTLKEILNRPDFPEAAYELAAILQFGTSYELVEWLARRLQEVSGRLEQKHKDNVMNQKAMVGAIEPNEQSEINRIARQQTAKNRGKSIEMPPLHIALAATAAGDQLQKLYEQSLIINKKLSEKLQQTEEKPKEAKEGVPEQGEASTMPEVNHRLEEQLKDALRKLEEAEN